MSDPGTTYRTREEVQEVRSKQDPIAGLQKYLVEWGISDEASLKAIDKESKKEVDQTVEEAKKSPFPDLKEFWTDIYVSDPNDNRLWCDRVEDMADGRGQYKGTAPPYMRGREKEEMHYY